MTAASEANQTAKEAAKSKPVVLLGRIGLVAYGIVHLLIAYLAIRVAVGASGSGTKTDKSGAIQTLASQPGGKVALWAVFVGLTALVLWQLAEAIWTHRRASKRLASAGKAIVFGALAFTVAKVASGSGGGGGGGQTTGKLLALPFGQILVAIVGVVVVAIAAFVVFHGWTKHFTEDLDLAKASEQARKTAIRLGQIGYVALGVAYGTVGALVFTAAVTHDPSKQVGLDAGLQSIAQQPFGAILLGIVAAGLACFGVYCMFDARFRGEPSEGRGRATRPRGRRGRGRRAWRRRATGVLRPYVR